ncbi:MAG TPA: DUF433 domain-containing protein [Terracidiphilus sp.]|jgi:uncharacterized protein (DUF433 family)|nr:DUF433 domain-containing protein [Terracidiphilus sp.]
MERLFTAPEASAIVKLPLKAVHKAMDGGLIKPRRLRRGKQVHRMLSHEQLVYLRLEAEGVRLLPMASRREVARAVESTPNVDTVTVSGGSAILVRVKDAREDVDRELERLRRVEQMVVSDPEVMGGTPVFRGTRIPVDLVAAMLEQEATVEEILDGYPSLTREHLELAPLYVAAFPQRGRPPSRPWAKYKPVRVTRYPRTVNM